MNFLSHLYLSGNIDPILIGNFMGDFVKGKQIDAYPEPIKKGIQLHREIDFFTDNHSIVSKSKNKLRKTHGHYAGVVVDIFYDHFLAANWNQYGSEPLTTFAQKAYQTLKNNRKILPDKAQQVLFYMERDDWLANYAHLSGIDQACKGMARRTKFRSNMEFAVSALEEHYAAFQEEFTSFFPVLEFHCKKFLKENSENGT